ncbi:MAG: hypothetical protein NTV70_15150 [Acidobacteria bacterium]|nr:hypothetical protein [Acidobacteriota bacterium]
MVKNAHLLEELDRQDARKHPLTIEQKYAILNAMYDYARKVGAFPPQDPLEGLEVDLRLAELLRHV